MKKFNILAVLSSISLVVLALFLTASDHIDAPAVAGTSGDIADFYAFEGDNPDNTVFIATLQGPGFPVSQTDSVPDTSTFDEDVLVEIKIDNTGDLKEDLVIQAIKRADTMYFFGPNAVDPNDADLLINTIDTTGRNNQVEITSLDATSPIVATNAEGMSFFAGPRRDPFFFDYNRFNEIANGVAAPEGFLPPESASDFFTDLNVLAIVVEVPNSLLGTAPEHIANQESSISGLPNAYNVWVTTSRLQQ